MAFNLNNVTITHFGKNRVVLYDAGSDTMNDARDHLQENFVMSDGTIALITATNGKVAYLGFVDEPTGKQVMMQLLGTGVDTFYFE